MMDSSQLNPEARAFQPQQASGTTTELKCDSCHIPQSQVSIPLKQCAKCRRARYCSRDCQKADWKVHKSTCHSGPSELPASSAPSTSSTAANTANASTSSSANTSKPCYRAKPFTALKNNAWLKDRPEADVYKLLIDVYRMRIEDQYKYEGDVDEGSMYSGGTGRTALRLFDQFLRHMTDVDKARPADKKILPDWWRYRKEQECVKAANVKDDWSWIEYAIEKHDIQEHYCEQSMPMQLRMFSEQIDGTTIMGQPGKAMLEMQVAVESGRLSSTLL